jgi:hypothetical protein
MRLGPRIALALVPLLCCGAADSLRDALPPVPPRSPASTHAVLFADDFSSGTLARWQADTPDVWSVRHGMLRADLADQRQLRSLIYAGDEEWTDYVLEFDVCMMRGVDKGAVVRAHDGLGLGVDLRGGSYQDVVAYVREWPQGRATAINADAAWNHVRIEVIDHRFRVWVNGELRLERAEARTQRGRIALAAYTGGHGQCTVYYDNVVVSAP